MTDTTAPLGLGIWIAFRPPNAAQRCVDIGAAWVAPRAGFNGWNDPGLTPAMLAEYKAAGLAVYPWIYPTMAGWKAAAVGFAALWKSGLCDGLIIDAEAEWCGPDAAANAREAVAFIAALRATCPGAFIAHAPVDYIADHPTFPWAEFGALDAVMPQVYAYEHDDRGHAHHLETVEKQWALWEAKHQDASPPRWPIGCTYRPRTRGYDAAGHPIPLTPWPDQGARVAADVSVYLDHPLTKDSAAPSLYALEAAHPEVVAMLAARVPAKREPQPTLPDGPAHPLGVADRAEWDADTTQPEAAAVDDAAVTTPGTPTSKSQDRMRAIRDDSDPPQGAA